MDEVVRLLAWNRPGVGLLVPGDVVRSHGDKPLGMHANGNYTRQLGPHTCGESALA